MLGWSKVPHSVSRDKELSRAALVVFVELAAWTGNGKNAVTRGLRPIGDAIGMDKATVRRCLDELAARGHIQIVGSGNARRRYVLQSRIFRNVHRGEAAGEVIEVWVEDGVTHKRLVQAREDEA